MNELVAEYRAAKRSLRHSNHYPGLDCCEKAEKRLDAAVRALMVSSAKNAWLCPEIIWLDREPDGLNANDRASLIVAELLPEDESDE